MFETDLPFSINFEILALDRPSECGFGLGFNTVITAVVK